MVDETPKTPTRENIDPIEELRKEISEGEYYQEDDREYNVDTLLERIKELEAKLTRSPSEKIFRHPVTDALDLRSESAKQEVDLMLEIAANEDMPVTIGVIDYDYFKTINDKYGRNAGDEFMKAFNNALELSLRESDLDLWISPPEEEKRRAENQFQYGGDEVALILPGLSVEDVPIVIQRLNSNLNQKLTQLAEAEVIDSIVVEHFTFKARFSQLKKDEVTSKYPKAQEIVQVIDSYLDSGKERNTIVIEHADGKLVTYKQRPEVNKYLGPAVLESMEKSEKEAFIDRYGVPKD